LAERHGVPRGPQGRAQHLVVIGMGKLGGRELNLSSDIDIVFSFEHTGQCDGSRGLSNEQFFTRLARAVVRSLSEVTEHGFCFRVDTRLRPFGESGPLVCSFGAMEQYYQREGRDWERYALVKARPVAGDLEAGADLLGRLAPFVYRRYIDFGAVEALQEMHAAVREDAANRGRENDVKRGPGGIREIEFLVQGFQLLRGGREPSLQTSSLLEAMRQVDELSLLPSGTVDSLSLDYEFLRRLENAIQALRDQQTHLVPEGEDLQRVARVMDHEDPGRLLDEIAGVRNRVSTLFIDCFKPREPETGESRWYEQWRSLKSGESADAGSPLGRFMARHTRLSLSQRGAQRLDRFMPRLLERLETEALTDAVLKDVFDLVQAISRRSAYLSLLVQNPAALDRMLDLFRISDWVAATVIRHPALLDELIDPALGQYLPTRTEMDETTGRILFSNPDTEAALAGLNHVKRAIHLRIAVAELETRLSPRQVQATLTDLAESLIGRCLELAQAEVRRQYGNLPGRSLGVIGYGTLGAAELGYGSDLDVIFLYDPVDAESDGPRPLRAERYHTMVARRMLGYLTATTASGRLFEVDTRLRPNGRAGLLVSSLSSFERYQRDDAWTWELQALTRARPAAGNTDIGRAFQDVRRSVLVSRQAGDGLRDQVRKMRQRMRDASPSGDPFKHGEGGLVDIDFVTQLGVLESAGGDPGILDLTGTFEQLGRLGEIGWIPGEQARALQLTHEALTRARHLAALSRQPPGSLPEVDPAWEICRHYLGPG
ncbi:MAG: bifunctional [glutamate--ammonia ligase]-adenylyl-L-tyrosine phosphorylase/[glutamate--ammonia-ligase] adenylyltransferase, partial [Xanthomonadales bacterium]|nr:bifunctional [glutamate--ammonia ligase]-adenylyl-L-tyrosine phosphorylase/[glutamate--ammonia-ligase] adenylyltransferase [Xanthomonadales bacterium]NIX14182.1 bifunctional [glutamate--ammonia ligase]-adenylyl-L-tyrosine phosphorylase/[glutamate--ammonia-ligase] adenylyltransferase [Xanthomonadales bacterium]